jgi:hypothetical protein
MKYSGLEAQGPSSLPIASAVTMTTSQLYGSGRCGREVGRNTAMRLRAAGVNAHYLRGGIEGWVAAVPPFADKPAR